MLAILLKLLIAHPADAVGILQSILDILKKDPALMADVVAFLQAQSAK